MRRNIDKIEIKNPPLQELSKKRSCFKRTCSTGCGCIVIFIIAALLILKLIAGPRTKELKKLPTNFPTSIPLYDKNDINKISFISGKQKSRGVEIAAYIPKLILSPIIFMMDNRVIPKKIVDKDGNKTITRKVHWGDFVNLMKEPVTDQRDIIQIEWTFLTAEPKFIAQYFTTELKKAGYEITPSTDNDNTKQFSFSQKEIDGVVFIKDEPNDPGTDYVSLTVHLPIQKN